ncbi:MAG TPA: M13 family metallopeptidase N-terminal domain-containing protein, partial [Pyrinomonadaceae bacterium]|nr:M13 family metallopeptidase N-terminal domain-containing protein [Pyrinomonadaceae bacterium]
MRPVGATLVALALCIVALGQGGGPSTGSTAAPAKGGRGFDVTRMDKSAAACQDFYQYANGNWLNTTEIPPAYSSWGSFNILAENNRSTLRTILDETSKNRNARRGTTEQKIGDFYATCMDEPAIEAAGAKPIQPELDRIAKIASQKDFQAQLARMHSMGIPALFGFGSVPDFKNSKVNGAIAAQGGLSLPNRDYYTKTDERTTKLREEFVAHVGRMFQLLGDSAEQAAANAKAVMAVETRLAENSRTPVELRDLSKRYNKMEMAKLAELTPNFTWADYFRGIGAPAFPDINIADPEFFRALSAALSEVPLADWKTYLRWQLVNAAAPALSSNFETENFNFFGKTLQGRKEQLPRWR